MGFFYCFALRLESMSSFARIKAKLYKKPIGEIVRLFRIDGCRMCGHDTKTHFLEISETGLIKIKEPIGGEKAW
jgi:hypothetical protein